MALAVDEPQVDHQGVFGEALKNGAGVHAVAAPGTGQAQHGHVSAEGSEKLGLVGRNPDGIVDLLPPRSVFRRGVSLKKTLVGQGGVGTPIENRRA